MRYRLMKGLYFTMTSLLWLTLGYAAYLGVIFMPVTRKFLIENELLIGSTQFSVNFSPDAFRAVERGMTMAKVEQILGRPLARECFGVSGSLSYRDADAEVTSRFNYSLTCGPEVARIAYHYSTQRDPGQPYLAKSIFFDHSGLVYDVVSEFRE